MSMGCRIAAEALTLVGAPFRLRGRSRETGLDCVGLVLAACRSAGIRADEPQAYGFWGTSRQRAEALLRGAGLEPVDRALPGDIILADSGPMQLHLLIRVEGGHVHAHAGLGRVVLTPPPLPWPALGNWRPRPDGHGS